MVNSGTNYGGSVSEVLYIVLGTGNEITEKDTAFVETQVDGKRSLPRLSATADPFSAYIASPGNADQTVTTTYAERALEVVRLTLYEEMAPEDFAAIWEQVRAVSGTTELAMNPNLLGQILELYKNKMGNQISKLFWQGDTASLTPKLAIMDGILKQALADANVIDVTNVGLITSANIVAILEAVWTAIPDHLIENPDMCIHMSTKNFRILQTVNLGLKDAYQGVLDTTIGRLFLEKRIKNYVGMPDNVMLAAVGSTQRNSNLVLGLWIPAETEAVRIDRVSNASANQFIRIDCRLGASYRAGEEIVMYTGVVIP